MRRVVEGRFGGKPSQVTVAVTVGATTERAAATVEGGYTRITHTSLSFIPWPKAMLLQCEATAMTPSVVSLLWLVGAQQLRDLADH